MVREIKEVSRYRTWFEPRHPDIQASIISPSTVRSPLNSLFLTFMDSGSWWWTGRPGVLRFMGSQGVGHDWATELNCIDIYANSQVDCRSLVFTPNVLVFFWLIPSLSHNQPSKIPRGLPCDLCHLHFYFHHDSPELMNLESLNARGKRSISFSTTFFNLKEHPCWSFKSTLETFSCSQNLIYSDIWEKCLEKCSVANILKLFHHSL